jgi:hypothetical protein
MPFIFNFLLTAEIFIAFPISAMTAIPRDHGD